MDAGLKAKIAEFEKKAKNIAISYGGDGTVLSTVRDTLGKKAIIPVRNYACCPEHTNMIYDILDGNGKSDLKMTRCPFIEFSFYCGIVNTTDRGISEIVVKGLDPTSAIRFNLLVDDEVFMKNVIADGIIASTAYGSTGYFKSVSRCIFKSDGLGIAFIAPTQGINNLVLNSTSRVELQFIRETEICITADKSQHRVVAKENSTLTIEEIPDAVSIFGLKEFHCQKCRTLRHSIIEDGVPVQDSYVS